MPYKQKVRLLVQEQKERGTNPSPYPNLILHSFKIMVAI